MNVLVFTNLFPNHLHPNHGIFTMKRMGHFNKIRGCRIKVIAPVPYFPPWPILGKWYQFSQIKKYEVIEGIEVYHPRYPLIPKISMPVHGLSMFLASLSLVKNIHYDFPFDLIDAHFIYPDGFAAILLGKIMKKPVILSALGSDIHEFKNVKLIKSMIQCAMKQSQHCITVCEALKEEMVKLGINKNKISVIPSGVDTERFKPVDRVEARKKLALSNRERIILSVGSLIPLKGFQTIIETLPKLLQKDERIRLYIIGEGPYEFSLKQKTERLGLSQHVIFVGQRPNNELATWYNAADVFCLASFREGWPNVIMESLASGTPVVATRVFGTPEILTSSNIGILVDSSPESLYTGLKKAFETIWNRKQIRTHVESRTWFAVAEEIRAVFCNVLGKNVRSLRDHQSKTNT